MTKWWIERKFLFNEEREESETALVVISHIGRFDILEEDKKLLGKDYV
jgi:hypothetical protein